MGARNPGTMRAQPTNLHTGNFSPGWSRGNGKQFTLSGDNYERFCLKKVNRPSKHATRNARADGQAVGLQREEERVTFGEHAV